MPGGLADLYDVTAHGVVVHVHVQPGAGRDAVAGRHGSSLRLRVTAPPVGGRANEAAGRLLAGALGLRSREVELVSGAGSRLKRFLVLGLEPPEVERRLRRVLDAATGARSGG
ncbi:MAG: DUF167 domain-containing protein [Acidimicrobiia bacterium]|nr:DUF167 domain-containing protein [Acidimicrobiia bacterium]